MAVRALLGDDSDVFLIGTAVTLDAAGVQVTGQTQEADTLVSLAASAQPDVIVISDPLDGIAAVTLVARCHAVCAPARVIVIGAHTSGLVIRDVMLHGAHAYLYRLDGLRECLHAAVRAVMRGYTYLSPSANAEYLNMLRAPMTHWQLDGEARTVLRLLARGEHTAAIAQTLCIPIRRVYSVRQKLRRRFGAASNEHLIQRAVEEGFHLDDDACPLFA